jgi:hypothetical protein
MTRKTTTSDRGAQGAHVLDLDVDVDAGSGAFLVVVEVLGNHVVSLRTAV